MKIALIADTFPPLRTSGAVQLRDLSREFVRQGHDLTVFLPDPAIEGAWALHDFDGARVLRLKAPRTKDIGYVRRTFGEWIMPYAMRRNLKKSPLAAERWDGVVWYSPSIFHGPFVKEVKRQSGCEGYLIIRDIFPEWALDLGLMRRGLTYRFFRRIARQQYEQANIIGVQTAGNLVYFEDWRKRADSRRLEVLENWLGAPGTARCRIRVEQTALAGRKVMIYAGNIGVAQGMDILLDLAQSLQKRSDIGFLFVGRGGEAPRLRQEAVDRGLDNVAFHDEIEPDEIPDLYAQCHAGIVALDPRHRSHNIPGKFLTYVQCGLPVLANVNRGNDLAELVRREQIGVVCETNQVEDLRQHCLDLVTKIETDHDLSNRCLRLFDTQFAVEGAAHQIVDALTEEKKRNSPIE